MKRMRAETNLGSTQLCVYTILCGQCSVNESGFNLGASQLGLTQVKSCSVNRALEFPRKQPVGKEVKIPNLSVPKLTI